MPDTEKPNPVGRPPKWVGADGFKRLSDSVKGYFEIECAPNEQGVSKTPELFGLCLYCKMGYDCFLDYESGNHDTETEEFSEPLKAARLACLSYANQRVFANTAGAVFTMVNLTRKFKEPWKNAQANEVTGANGGPIELKGIAEILSKAHEQAKNG